MEKIIIRVVVLTSACCFSTKHVYVENPMSWEDAREYCRKYYTDFSPLSNDLEEKVFNDSVDPKDEGWIGAYWNQTTNSWKWSGGDNVTSWNNFYSDDGKTQLNQLPDTKNNMYWTWDKWFSKDGTNPVNFFCFNLTVVQEEKTWEEALGLCRQNGTDLTSLLSVTENLLATNQTSQTGITEPVWIGLRYLGDGWMWVNGDPLEYENWSQEGDQQCPVTDRCGALTKGGVWENLDCQEKLSFICG